jgi:hypothetical protein
MNTGRIKVYLVRALVLFGVLFAFQLYLVHLKGQERMGSTNSYYLVLTIQSLFYLLLGIFLGYEIFVEQYKGQGQWRVNGEKLICPKLGYFHSMLPVLY